VVFNPICRDILHNAWYFCADQIQRAHTPCFSELLRTLDLLLSVKPLETREINCIEKMRRKLIILSSE